MSMSKVIQEFREVLDIYSDCNQCGAVIADKELKKPDILNPGRFRAMCPSCGRETSRVSFPPETEKQILELMTELAEADKYILVMILVAVVHEILVSSFTERLMERKYCPSDVVFAVVDSMEFRGKLKFIKDLTGKSLEKLAKEFGFKDLYKEFDNLKIKRNAFIHEGEMHKLINKNFDKFTFKEKAELDEKDLKQAISCAEEMVHFFAQIFTKHGKYESMYDE
jgi:hypothetical protein